MSLSGPRSSSQLFTLRVWSEDLGDGCVELRGKVQHAVSGEQQYFHDWPTLISFLSGAVQGPDSAGLAERPADPSAPEP